MKNYKWSRTVLILIFIIASSFAVFPFIQNVEGAVTTWPGDHVIDGITESFGPGDIINAGGDVTIQNGGSLVLNGAILNFTADLKEITILNGTLEVTGNGEIKANSTGWEYDITADNGGIIFDNATISRPDRIDINPNATASINNTKIHNSTGALVVYTSNFEISNTTIIDCSDGISVGNVNGSVYINNTDIINYQRYGISFGNAPNLSLFISNVNMTGAAGCFGSINGATESQLYRIIMDNVTISTESNFHEVNLNKMHHEVRINNTRILGEGRGISIRHEPGYSLPYVNITHTYLTRVGGSGAGLTIIGNTSNSNVLVDDLTMFDITDRGIRIEDISTLSLSNSYFENVDNDAIYLNFKANETKFSIFNIIINKFLCFFGVLARQWN